MPINREQFLADIFDKHDKSRLEPKKFTEVINYYKDKSDEQLLADTFDNYDKSWLEPQKFTEALNYYNTPQKKSPDQSAGGEDLQTQQRQGTNPLVKLETTTEPIQKTWFEQNEQYVFQAIAISVLLLIVFSIGFVIVKFKTQIAKTLFNKRVLYVLLALVGVLAITNPSLKQFKEFQPTIEHENDRRIYDISRRNNYIILSVYVCFYRASGYNKKNPDAYIGIFNNFYKIGYIKNGDLY